MARPVRSSWFSASGLRESGLEDLNVHFHMLLLDGVYVADGDSVRWVPVPPPTTEEVQEVVTQIAWTVERWLGTQGYAADEPCEEDQDDDANGVLLSASVAGRVALGVRAGAKVRRLQRASTRPFRLPALCAEDQGYNLHAAVVIREGDINGLERLCRYVLRPPLARSRLHRREDGLLVLTLRKPYANGTTDFIFSEVELAQRLAALVPPKGKNGISYHGVFGARHRHRNEVIPCGGRLTLHAVVRPPATLAVLNSLERSAKRQGRGPP